MENRKSYHEANNLGAIAENFIIVAIVFALVITVLDELSRGTLATVNGGTLALAGGLQYALAPELAPLKALFDAGRLAPLLNVGPLVQRTSKEDFLAGSVPLPPKLFSHNDQQSIWQSDLPEGASSGWGGRVGDLVLSGNGGSVFTCISVTGNAVFLSGQQAVQYQISTSGAVAINGIRRALYGSGTAQAALRSLITPARAHLFEDEYTRITIESDTPLGERHFLAANPDRLVIDIDPETEVRSLSIAARSLARITGEDLEPQVLDAIFSRFCVGK